MLNNPKIYADNINAYKKLGKNPFLHSQDIERNKILTSFKDHNSGMNWQVFPRYWAKMEILQTDGRTDNLKTVYPHTSYAGGGGGVYN